MRTDENLGLIDYFPDCRRRESPQARAAGLASCDPMYDMVHMAKNVEIDRELIKAALSLSGKRSKRAVIDEALRPLRFSNRSKTHRLASLK